MTEKQRDIPDLDPLFAIARGDFQKAFQMVRAETVHDAISFLYSAKKEYERNKGARWINENEFGPIPAAAKSFFDADPNMRSSELHLLEPHFLGMITMLKDGGFTKKDVWAYLNNEFVPNLRIPGGQLLNNREEIRLLFARTLKTVYKE